MNLTSLVLIDTCIWAGFFNRPNSAEHLVAERLVEDDRAAIIGPVLGEVLYGFRRDEQADWVASSLAGIHELVLDWDDWREAARLGRELKSRGHSLPLTDLAIAAVAIRRRCEVYSTDPHFDRFTELLRYRGE